MKKKKEKKEKIQEANTSELPAINNGGVTPEIISRWKSQHRKVYEITLNADGETLVGYFHRPSMETMSASTKLIKTDEIKGVNVLFDNCWLGGAPEIKEDAVIRLGACRQLNVVLMGVQGSIKNI